MHGFSDRVRTFRFVPAYQGETVGSERLVLFFARYLGYTNTVDPDWQLSDVNYSA